jgi:hypothetical protein
MRQILGGRAPAEVANRAGHSVEVLLRSLRGEIREHRPRSDVAFRGRSGGRRIRTHGDVAATMVFESIRGSWFATTATCVVAVQAGSPSKIIPRISRARAATPRRRELRITSVFPCVAPEFNARVSFRFSACGWRRSLAVDGSSETSRGHASATRHARSSRGAAPCSASRRVRHGCAGPYTRLSASLSH